uniref:Uncharacterized protein n=1 Tax=Lepeophtheirus salmonis TaxID=72036 RepID=A0A0K2SVS5_LEPSM
MALRQTEEFLNEKKKQIKQLGDSEIINDFEKNISNMISSIKPNENGKKSRSKSQENHRNPFEGFLRTDNRSRNDRKEERDLENQTVSSFRPHIRRDSKQLYQQQRNRNHQSRLSLHSEDKNSRNSYLPLRVDDKGGSNVGGAFSSLMNPHSESERSKKSNNIFPEIEEQVRKYEEQKLKKEEKRQKEAFHNNIQNFYRSKMSNSGHTNPPSGSLNTKNSQMVAHNALKKNQETWEKIANTKEGYDNLFHNQDKNHESKRANEGIKGFWNQAGKQDEQNARGSRKNTYF